MISIISMNQLINTMKSAPLGSFLCLSPYERLNTTTSGHVWNANRPVWHMKAVKYIRGYSLLPHGHGHVGETGAYPVFKAGTLVGYIPINAYEPCNHPTDGYSDWRIITLNGKTFFIEPKGKFMVPYISLIKGNNNS